MENLGVLNLTVLRQDELIETEGGFILAVCIIGEIATCAAFGMLTAMAIN